MRPVLEGSSVESWDLEAEVRPVVEGSLVENWDVEGEEGGEGRAPVRKRSERAV